MVGECHGLMDKFNWATTARRGDSLESSKIVGQNIGDVYYEKTKQQPQISFLSNRRDEINENDPETTRSQVNSGFELLVLFFHLKDSRECSDGGKKKRRRRRSEDSVGCDIKIFFLFFYFCPPTLPFVSRTFHCYFVYLWHFVVDGSNFSYHKTSKVVKSSSVRKKK